MAASAGLTVHPMARWKGDIRIGHRLALLASSLGYRVLDVQNPQSKFWGAFAAARAGAGLVSTLNSWYESEYGEGLKGGLYQAVEWITRKKHHLFIAVSEDIRNKLVESGVSPSSVTTIPNSPGGDFDAVGRDPRWLKKRFGFPESAVVCAAVGRLVWAKGHLGLVRAMALAKHPGLHCLIVGEGPDRKALESSIRRLGLRGRVKLAGFQDRDLVYRIVKSSDIFAMPSVSEGTPISLMEAAMLGAPVVASCAGGIPEIIRDGRDGILVTPDRPEELANALDTMLASPSNMRGFAESARSRMKRKFGVSAQASATAKVYERAAKLASG
jgi:glycosyltransferase involved in cell wall biosynthesis